MCFVSNSIPCVDGWDDAENFFLPKSAKISSPELQSRKSWAVRQPEALEIRCVGFLKMCQAIKRLFFVFIVPAGRGHIERNLKGLMTILLRSCPKFHSSCCSKGYRPFSPSFGNDLCQIGRKSVSFASGNEVFIDRSSTLISQQSVAGTLVWRSFCNSVFDLVRCPSVLIQI